MSLLSGKKIALIASGGGMTCSYSAGSILALVDKFTFTQPEIVIGCSGNAGTMAYYVAGQYKSIKNIWQNLLGTRKFINHLRFWKVIDIDYLIDQIFGNIDPLNTATLFKSAIRFFIPTTDCFTGKIKYFSNKSDVNFLEILRAAKAMPLIYGKQVIINGIPYCDTRLSSSVGLNIRKAKSLGVNKILVLDNSFENPLTGQGLNLWVKTRSSDFKKNYFNGLEAGGRISEIPEVFCLRPEKKLKITTLNNDAGLLKETFDLGYSETFANPGLEKFFQGL